MDELKDLGIIAVGAIWNAVSAQGARRQSPALVRRGNEAVLARHLYQHRGIDHDHCPHCYHAPGDEGMSRAQPDTWPFRDVAAEEPHPYGRQQFSALGDGLLHSLRLTLLVILARFLVLIRLLAFIVLAGFL